MHRLHLRVSGARLRGTHHRPPHLGSDSSCSLNIGGIHTKGLDSQSYLHPQDASSMSQRWHDYCTPNIVMRSPVLQGRTKSELYSEQHAFVVANDDKRHCGDRLFVCPRPRSLGQLKKTQERGVMCSHRTRTPISSQPPITRPLKPQCDSRFGPMGTTNSTLAVPNHAD